MALLDEIKNMSKVQLLDLAKGNKLRVTSQMSKAEIIDVILTAAKKRKEPLAMKSPEKPVSKGKADEDKRIEAARKAAKRFIAGVRAQPRTKKRAPREKEKEQPPAAETRPARPAGEAGPRLEAGSREKAPAAKATKAAKERPMARIARKKPAARRPAEEAQRAPEGSIQQRAEEGKYYLGAEQRVMPPVEAIEIPSGYNVDRIVAMVRDPYWILAYWEVTDRKYHELERHFGAVWPKCKMILRVFDKTNDKPAHFDIVIAPGARNWYISVSAERRYQIAIGALSPDGTFEQIAISNIVETPSDRVSDRVDEHWMVPDDVFKKIFAASGGHDMHAASAEFGGLLEKRLLEEIGSGSVTSFGSGAWPKAEKGRKFRFWVATELILYGGTEPDARVTVQGKEVKLRPDGTFSMRFALPDGKVPLPVTATSGDGIEERTIDTNVTKKSHKKEPVIK